VRVASLAAAKPHLTAVVPKASPDLDELPHERGSSFFVQVLRGSAHGSDTFVYDLAGVFVAADHVVVVKRVALRFSTIPRPGTKPQPDASKIEVLPPHVGHIQLVQEERTYDHFLDLETGKYLMGFESTKPLRWTIDADYGPVAGDCPSYWDN
jgi:hypothetical protein